MMLPRSGFLGEALQTGPQAMRPLSSRWEQQPGDASAIADRLQAIIRSAGAGVECDSEWAQPRSGRRAWVVSAASWAQGGRHSAPDQACSSGRACSPRQPAVLRAGGCGRGQLLGAALVCAACSSSSSCTMVRGRSMQQHLSAPHSTMQCRGLLQLQNCIIAKILARVLQLHAINLLLRDTMGAGGVSGRRLAAAVSKFLYKHRLYAPRNQCSANAAVQATARAGAVWQEADQEAKGAAQKATNEARKAHAITKFPVPQARV